MSKTEAFIGRPVRIPKALREELETAIHAHLTAVEKLTAVLDKADGDEDLEPNLGTHPAHLPLSQIDCEEDVGDQPETTWRETHGKGGWGDTNFDDDREPSLAHTHDLNQERARRHLRPLNLPSQGTWVQCDQDREAEHDGREPSLGSTLGAFDDQTRWKEGATDDREHDDEREAGGEI